MDFQWKSGDSSEVPSERVMQAAVDANAITVSAIVDAREDARAEALQAIVSQWSPPTTWNGFAAHDAAGTDGLNSIGYFGAVFDGRFVYFAPEQKNPDETHGVVLRYDTHGGFTDRDSYSAYDASQTDGLPT